MASLSNGSALRGERASTIFFLLLGIASAIVLELCVQRVAAETKSNQEPHEKKKPTITQIAEQEELVARTFNRFIKVSEIVLEKMQKYVEQYEELERPFREKAKNSAELDELMVSNPLVPFRILFRLRRVWPKIIDALDHVPWKEVMESVEGLKNMEAAIQENRKKVATALLRVQEVYSLPTADLVMGKLLDTAAASSLTAADCFFVGSIALSDRRTPKVALQWLRLAQQLWTSNQTVSVEKIQKAIADAETESERTDWEQPQETAFQSTYYTLCRKVFKKSDPAQLSCFQSYHEAKSWTLIPERVEPLLPNSEIVIYHDIVSNNDLKRMKSVEPIGSKPVDSKTELLAERIAHKIEQLVKRSLLKSPEVFLEPSKQEPFRVYHYTFADFHEPQQEPLKHRGQDETEMISALLYVDVADRGGEAVFPDFKMAVKPSAGSVLISRGLPSEGMFVECPIVMGSQSVATMLFNVGVVEKDQRLN